MAASSSQGGHLAVVLTLIEHGADIHTKNRNRHTALNLAKIQKRTEIVECLELIAAKVEKI